MRNIAVIVFGCVALWTGGCSKSGGGVKLHTDTDSVAYVIGLNVGANLLKMDSTLNAAAVCKGIADYFAGRQSMTMEEAQTFYLRYVNYAGRFTPPTSVAIRCARALIRFPRGCARG